MVQGSAHEILGVKPNTDWATVRAVYRALARRFHPDGTAPDSSRMAQINRAYETMERERRSRSDRGAQPVAVGPGHPVVRSGGLLERMLANAQPTPIIDFGEYAGWRLADVARVDPRYLRWLSRHSSGIRYRGAIAELLAGDPEIGRRAALVR